MRAPHVRSGRALDFSIQPVTPIIEPFRASSAATRDVVGCISACGSNEGCVSYHACMVSINLIVTRAYVRACTYSRLLSAYFKMIRAATNRRVICSYVDVSMFEPNSNYDELLV